MIARLALGALLVAGCRTLDGPSGQGGAQFNQVAARASLPLEAMFGVCWPPGSPSEQRVNLITLGNGEVMFEAVDGASNSTARCLREIASSYPGPKTAGQVSVAPPAKAPSGWAVLAYVQLLSPLRFGPERGLLQPSPLVQSCLSQGSGLRPGIRFQISVDPELKVRLESAEGALLLPLTDSERCVEAILGATVWPGTRSFTFALDGSDPAAPQLAGDVGHYFMPAGAEGGLDPITVKEALTTRGPAVAACWEAALARRAGLGGGRSLRLRINDTGGVAHVAVLGNVSAEAATAADYLLDACLVKAAMSARFPAGTAGDTVYSWVFAQRL